MADSQKEQELQSAGEAVSSSLSAIRYPLSASSGYPLSASMLRWRCRRGMRELDVLLERYLQQRYPCAPAAEQHAFEALLDLPDPRLLALITGREIPADPEWAHVIAKLADPDR